MKKFFIAAIGALTLAAPVGAVPIEIPIGLDGRTAWVFSPDTSGDDFTYFVEVLRQDVEGDILINYTNIDNESIGYAWVDCKRDQISFDGGKWEYVDHRNTVGWHSDIACGRPVR